MMHDQIATFIFRTIRIKEGLGRRTMLPHVKGSMLHVRPFRKNKDAIVESLMMLIPRMPESGDLKHWVGYVYNKLEWEEMIKNLAIRTHPCYNNYDDYPHTRSREISDDHDHEQPNNDNAHVLDTRHPPTPPSTTRTNSNDMLSPIFDFLIKTCQQIMQGNY